ncbi:RCC1 domain-containing protein [Cohnella cholangitidis]|uniref:Regulator of chromosome condensation (RCC1) repeat-containing protein n=1 Tax=Cohnella cholangitidis TaxID=2598458 RepID=A0A7G5BVI3_9BACL|nr:hypothetical protein FPL14_06890 [Cohnella cholangitidis]
MVSIAAGQDHSLALKSDGTVVGWGYNFYGSSDLAGRTLTGVVAIAAAGIPLTRIEIGWHCSWMGRQY